MKRIAFGGLCAVLLSGGIGCAHPYGNKAPAEPTAAMETTPSSSCAAPSAQASAGTTEEAAAAQPAVEPVSQKEVAAPPANAKIVCIAKSPGVVAPCPACGPERVFFETNSAELSDADKTVLDREAECIKANTGLQVTIAGGADVRGGTEFNLDLGKKRADAVSAYLGSKGVCDEQLKTITLGKNNPLCDSKDADCLSQNRRVTILAVPARNVASRPRTIE